MSFIQPAPFRQTGPIQCFCVWCVSEWLGGLGIEWRQILQASVASASRQGGTVEKTAHSATTFIPHTHPIRGEANEDICLSVCDRVCLCMKLWRSLTNEQEGGKKNAMWESNLMSLPWYPLQFFQNKSTTSPPHWPNYIISSPWAQKIKTNQVKEIVDCCSAIMTNNPSTSTPLQHNTSVYEVNAILRHISPWGALIRGNCFFAYRRPKISRTVRSWALLPWTRSETR